MGKRTRLILAFVLAAIWTAYWGWSYLSETGLAASVARLEVQYIGAFYPTPTLFVVWFIGLVAALQIAPKTAAGGVDFGGDGTPVDPVQKARRTAKWTVIAGLLIVGLGAGLYQYALTLPDGTEAPITVNLASFDEASLPLGQRVTLLGNRPDYGAIVTEKGDSKNTDTYYVPVFAPGANPLKTPAQFFQVVEVSTLSEPSDSLFEADGYLSKTSLDLLARDVLREQGLTVADTTYQLRTGGQAPQYEMFTYAGIAGVMGLIFALVGALSLLLGRRKA